jgi:hypothetical protein
MKEAGTVHWDSPNTGANNSSGFTGLGSGIRFSTGSFYNLLISSYFWSAAAATTAWNRKLYSYIADVHRIDNVN